MCIYIYIYTYTIYIYIYILYIYIYIYIYIMFVARCVPNLVCWPTQGSALILRPLNTLTLRFQWFQSVWELNEVQVEEWHRCRINKHSSSRLECRPHPFPLMEIRGAGSELSKHRRHRDECLSIRHRHVKTCPAAVSLVSMVCLLVAEVSESPCLVWYISELLRGRYNVGTCNTCRTLITWVIHVFLTHACMVGFHACLCARRNVYHTMTLQRSGRRALRRERSRTLIWCLWYCASLWYTPCILNMSGVGFATNLQIWFLGTTPFDTTPFICLWVRSGPSPDSPPCSRGRARGDDDRHVASEVYHYHHITYYHITYHYYITIIILLLWLLHVSSNTVWTM